MESAWSRIAVKKQVLLPVCLVVAVLASTLRADDFEDPIDPGPSGGSGCITVFADVEVEPEHAGGLAIDAKEAIEPQTTVMLMMSDVSTSPGQTVVVHTFPVFHSWLKWSETGWSDNFGSEESYSEPSFES
ncbi:MAG: hypothetical protein KAX19_10995 [Candidatus Brocadiae bacterium]|nr:hypothetical protein [Candidatus Brocadiia bacterium]